MCQFQVHFRALTFDDGNLDLFHYGHLFRVMMMNRVDFVRHFDFDGFAKVTRG